MGREGCEEDSKKDHTKDPKKDLKKGPKKYRTLQRLPQQGRGEYPHGHYERYTYKLRRSRELTVYWSLW